MKELFEKIAEVHARTEGWCDLEKANTLAALVLALKPEVVCEIGIFGGKSFLPMALACKHNNYGTVVGIEPWNKETATQGYEGENLEYWTSTVDFQIIRQKFMASLVSLDLEKFVNIIEKPSYDVDPPSRLDLFHCDGQHTAQAVRDVQRYCPMVRTGGIVILDDLTWSNSGDQPVIRAEQWLLGNGFERLYTLGTGAVYQRIQ